MQSEVFSDIRHLEKSLMKAAKAAGRNQHSELEALARASHRNGSENKDLNERIGAIRNAAPFRSRGTAFRFIDLFCGVGGIRMAVQNIGGRCVFSSEWDKYARETYMANFGEFPYGDINMYAGKDMTDAEIDASIPDHDLLVGGFPCQPFSLAGVSSRRSLGRAHGFECETQGTLFFNIAKIIAVKSPRVVFLENVRNLVNHNKGVTFDVIKKTIEGLGYRFTYKLINANTKVPQNRIRCYMVAVREGQHFTFPTFEGPQLELNSILQTEVDESFTISERSWQGHKNRTERNEARGVGFSAKEARLDRPSNTLLARYYKDGKECLIPQDGKPPRMLTPRECARLQGFPDSFLTHPTKNRAYRQFGNSVAVPVVQEILKRLRPLIVDNKIAPAALPGEPILRAA